MHRAVWVDGKRLHACTEPPAEGCVAVRTVQVRKPLWAETPDGSFSLERPGALVLELAPVAPNSGTSVGARAYQWDKKQARSGLTCPLRWPACSFMLRPHGPC